VKSLGVFDIGSNTILLTAGRRDDAGAVEILLDIHDVARLSEGLQDGKPLQSAAKARALQTLENFREQAHARGVTQLIAAGTAAFRRASDGKAFAKQIETALSIPVRILSGDEEATYSYASAAHDFGDASLGMIDIGGGSTEIVFSREGPRFSLPVGTVRLTEAWIRVHPIPDAEWQAVQRAIRESLRTHLPSALKRPSQWAAVAATPASLAAVAMQLQTYDPEQVHGYRLKQADLAKLVESLRVKGISERNRMPGMDPKRAELLPVGGLILLTISQFLEIDEITVSDHGLRYGILYEALAIV